MIRDCCVALSLLCAVAAAACIEEPAAVAPPRPPIVMFDVRTSGPMPLPPAEPAVDVASVDVPHVAEPVPSLLEREALAIEDGDLVDHKAFGLQLLQKGESMNAIGEIKKALSIDSSAETWALLGDAYLRVGDVDRGVPCLLEAVSLDVDQLSARRLLARHFLSLNDAASARAHAEEWVRLQPQNPSSRQALGRALTQGGMWKEAIAQFLLVVDVQPDNAYAFNNLGFAALQLGDNELAVHHLERVLSLNPQQGYMLNNLGVGYERLGRTAEAHAAFARAAELSPRYAQAALNRDRVQRGLSHSQRVVSADTLLKLRDGLHDDVAPLGTGPADGVDIPALPSFPAE
ncbi:MAG: tetratricopeptide repeat protein [Deltaproteobacteria bacterium]|nr:tetratricopeptide repeat protein [Deltaproteobacteria bacterium]